jgi:hypothetical protein
VADEMELLRRFIDEIPGPSADAWARARAAIAAARSGEEPRFADGTGRGRRRVLAVAGGVSSEGSQPPALKAYRQPRKQRRTARALAAAGAVAALAAGALTAADVTGAFGSGSSQQIQPAAYMTRVEHALAIQAEEGLVSYSRAVFPPGTVIEPVGVGSWQTNEPVFGTPPPPSPFTADVMVMWQYQDSDVDVTSTATGQPVSAEESTTTGRRETAVVVSYRDATWWRATQTQPPGAQVPAPACSRLTDPGSDRWWAYIAQELPCGVYHLDGRQWVDGIDAVKLTGRRGRVVLWIDPATYLPVREFHSMGPPGVGPGQIDFRWFPVTAASLAHLKVSVPAGFRQVQPPPGW